MQGYQLTFFTQQGRSHQGAPLGEWLIREARALGISGATLMLASEGFGHERKWHSAHFFELAQQPVEVTMAVDAQECACLFQRLRQEQIKIFYVKAPIEFGSTL
jgi:PII-like signaling protein